MGTVVGQQADNLIRGCVCCFGLYHMVLWQNLVIWQEKRRGERPVSICYSIAFTLHNLLASLLHSSDGRSECIQEVRDDLTRQCLFRSRHCSYSGNDLEVDIFISPR